jgi:putative transposase
VLKTLAAQKECQIEEGHLLPDHVLMLIDIRPKYSVAQVVGYIKGKSAIYIARTFLGHRLDYRCQNFWARGYYGSTVGRDEKTIRDYSKNQEEHDRKLDQWNLFDKTPQDPS